MPPTSEKEVSDSPIWACICSLHTPRLVRSTKRNIVPEEERQQDAEQELALVGGSSGVLGVLVEKLLEAVAGHGLPRPEGPEKYIL